MNFNMFNHDMYVDTITQNDDGETAASVLTFAWDVREVRWSEFFWSSEGYVVWRVRRRVPPPRTHHSELHSRVASDVRAQPKQKVEEEIIYRGALDDHAIANGTDDTAYSSKYKTTKTRNWFGSQLVRWDRKDNEVTTELDMWTLASPEWDGYLFQVRVM